MIGEWIRFGVTALCVVGGLFALLTALLGLFRFDYALNRLHAAAIADTLALGLVLLGVMVAVGFRAVLWKLVLVLVIQWYTSPLSSHMLAQFEYRAGQEDLARYLELPEETEEAMMPGTPQPTPMSMGMKDLPDRPNLRNTRSRMKAIRAM